MKRSRPKFDKSFTVPIYDSSSVPVEKPSSEVLLSFPNCRVHIVGSDEAVEIASGDFSIVELHEDGVAIATVIRVGDDLQWPLTRDEPVVKVDYCDYLFSLPVRGGEPLNYGVSFMEKFSGTNLGELDEFLMENSCFSISNLSVVKKKKKKGVNWKAYAPKIEEFNRFLAKAIVNGTGAVVKGIFMCSNAYTKQVQNEGRMILLQSVPEKEEEGGRSVNGPIKVTLKRVRDLSKLIEEISREMLEGIGIVIGSVIAPLLQSEQAKRFLSMAPGQVLLVSLQAVNRVMEAAETAQKLVLSATTLGATRMLSQRFGEDVGEAAGDVLVTAENCMNTAWNVYKMRKAMNPTTAVGSRLLIKNALRSYDMNKSIKL